MSGVVLPEVPPLLYLGIEEALHLLAIQEEEVHRRISQTEVKGGTDQPRWHGKVRIQGILQEVMINIEKLISI